MATVHTAYGPGRIVDQETVRGRTQYKVAGDGFEVWLDETKIAGLEDGDGLDRLQPLGDHWLPSVPLIEHEAGDEHPFNDNPGVQKQFERFRDRDDDDYDDRMLRRSRREQLGGLREDSGEDRPQGWYADEEPAGAPRLTAEELMDGVQWQHPITQSDHLHPTDEYATDEYPPGYTAGRLAWAPLDHDNSTDLPYNPDPQHDAIGFSGDDGSSTLQPIHHIDADERLRSADSLSFKDDGDYEDDEPGPNPELFAKQSHLREALHPSLLLNHPWVKDKVKDLAGEKAVDTFIGGSTGKAVAMGANAIGGEINQAMDSVSPGPGWGDLIKGGSRHEATPAALLPLLLRTVGPSMASGLLGGGDSGGDATAEMGPGEGWGDLVKDGSYRPAGLDDRYIDLTASADYHNDPAAQFRHDPDAYINRVGHLMDEGLNPRFAEYMELVEADRNIRTAAWKDVRAKAMRLKTSGAVHVKDIAPSRIMASVDGDHGTYDVTILKGASIGGLTANSISNWHCSCEWGRWAFRRKHTFVGRLCSHGYAAYLTMQSAALKGQPRRPKRGPADTVIVKRPGREQYLPTFTFAAGRRQADALQNGPERLTPDMVVNDADDAHMFLDVTKDERKDVGPDDVVSDKDIVHFSRLMRHCEANEQPYPRQLVAFLARYADCDDASDDTQADYQVSDATGANEYLEQIRSDGDRKQEKDFGSMAERVHKIQDAVEEARAHGADADRFVAMVRQAAPEYGSGDPGANAYAEKGGVGYTKNPSGNGTYNFNRTPGDGVNRNVGGDPGSSAYAEKGGITYMENADQPGTYSFQRGYPDGNGGTTTQKPESGGQATNRVRGREEYPSTTPGSPRDPEGSSDLSGIKSAPGKAPAAAPAAAPASNQSGSGGDASGSGSKGDSGSGGSGGDGGKSGSGGGQDYTAPAGGTKGPVSDGGVAGAENGNNDAIKGNEYTVQAGDTLTDIAQRAYGDMNRYEDIAKANGITDVDNLEVGKTYKLDNAQGNNGVKGDVTNPAGGGVDKNPATADAGPAVETGLGGVSTANGFAATTPKATTDAVTPASSTSGDAGAGVQTPATLTNQDGSSQSITDPGLTTPAAPPDSGKVGSRHSAKAWMRWAAEGDGSAAPASETTPAPAAPGVAPTPAPGTGQPTPAATAQPGGSAPGTAATPSAIGPSKETDTYDPNDPTTQQQPGSGAGRNDGTSMTPASPGGMDDMGGMLDQGLGMAGDIASGIGNAMPNIADAIGGIASGIGSIFSSKQDADEWRRYAYPADGGDDFDPKTMPHIPFAGSGNPGPLEFGTSEEYADTARKKADDVTDLGSGDLTKPMGDWQKQGSYDEDGDPYREASIGYSTDDDSDIVRRFQAHLGETALGAGAGQSAGRFDDFASAAQGFLRTAGRNYSLAEQSELIREGDKGGARNLASLDLAGTHYEEMDSLGW